MMAEQIFLLLRLASMHSHLGKSESNFFFFFFEDGRWPPSFGSSSMSLLSFPKPRVRL